MKGVVWITAKKELYNYHNTIKMTINDTDIYMSVYMSNQRWMRWDGWDEMDEKATTSVLSDEK